MTNSIMHLLQSNKESISLYKSQHYPPVSLRKPSQPEWISCGGENLLERWGVEKASPALPQSGAILHRATPHPQEPLLGTSSLPCAPTHCQQSAIWVSPNNGYTCFSMKNEDSSLLVLSRELFNQPTEASSKDGRSSKLQGHQWAP